MGGQASQSQLVVTLLAGFLGLLGVALTVFVGTVGGRLAEAANRRREAYADAVRALVAWAEYPYRIRRRTSDTPEELGRLAALGNDLQERLRYHQTWVMTESRWVAGIYEETRAVITRRSYRWSQDAWKQPPVTVGVDMNLGDWGPGDVMPAVLRLESAISCRFGWRRPASLVGLRPGFVRQLELSPERHPNPGSISSRPAPSAAPEEAEKAKEPNRG